MMAVIESRNNADPSSTLKEREQHKKNRDGIFTWIMIAIFLSLPLIVLAYWHTQNVKLPSSDAANFLQSADFIYGKFINEGFWEGLRVAFFDRHGWRPILFPALAVPFLAISEGNFIFAVAGVGLLTTCALVVFAYLILRTTCLPIPAALGASCVGLMATTQWAGIHFFSNSALNIFIIGTIYFLARSNNFKNVSTSIAAGLFLLIGSLIYPTVFSTSITGAIVFLLWRGWRDRDFSLIPIGGFVILSLIALGCLAVSPLVQEGSKITLWRNEHLLSPYLFKVGIRLFGLAIIGMIVLVLTISHARKWLMKGHGRLLLYLGTPVVISILLWLPNARQLAIWTWQNTFGWLIKVAPAPTFNGPLHQAYSYIQSLGLFILLTFGVFCILSIVCKIQANTSKKLKTSTSDLKNPSDILLLIAAIPIPVVIAFAGFQSSVMRLTPVGIALAIVLASYALRKDNPLFLKRAAITGTTVTAVIAFTIFFANGAGIDIPRHLKTGFLGNSSLRPFIEKVEPNQLILNWLDSKQKKYKLRRVMVAWPSMNANIFTLVFLAHSNNKKTTVNVQFAAYSTFSDPETFDRMRKEGITHFLGMLHPNHLPSAESMRKARASTLNPVYLLNYGILERHFSGTTNRVGITLIDKLDVYGQTAFLFSMNNRKK